MSLQGMTNEKTTPNKPKEKKSINTFVLLFIVLVVMAILTYILPAGQYARHMVDGRNVVVPNSYKTVPNTPVGFLGIFSAIHAGMVEAGPIIFYVLIIGGMIGVMNSTGAIAALLGTASKKFANKGNLFIALLMLLFSLGGALLGMAEEGLIWIPIVIPFALALGYDVITGTAIVLFGMGIGFTTAVMNPFTIGIAQSIAGLPMFSGIGLRLILFVIMYIVVVTFICNYANKVKKDRSYGFFGDGKYEGTSQVGDVKFETKHKLILAAFVITIATLAYGCTKLDWYMGEMSAVFIMLTIVIALIGKISPDNLINSFIKGGENILAGALVIGLARGIVVVLTNGKIIDTILYHAATTLQHTPAAMCTAGMFVVQACIHFLVPSGSGQAMLTMPIMIPLADLLHVSRQTACLIFTLADGIGNTILPTSGYFMAALAMSGIPWSKWAKRMLIFVLFEYLFSIIVVVFANSIHYGPF